MSMVQTKSFNLAIYFQGNKNANKLALVLPGKLDTKDYGHMRSHVDYLAGKGFLAVSFDPPGTWESEGDISLYTMTNYQKAIHELIEHFGNKPTFVMGHSRGASMAIVAGLINPHITGFAPVFCSLHADDTWDAPDPKWQEMGYQISMRDLPPGGGEEVKEFRLPFGFYEDQLQYKVADGLKTCDKPKLFFLGTEDTIATPEKVRALFAISQDPKELYILDSDHDYRAHNELIDEVNSVIGKFLEKYHL